MDEGFDLIKYIGDEVMLFYKFKNDITEKEKIIVANNIYDLLYYNNDKEYIKSINELCVSNLLEPKIENKYEIETKIFVGLIEKAKMLLPYKHITNDIYDLIGPDVDRAARIKEMASPNMLVTEKKFKDLLCAKYQSKLTEYKWKKLFKGIKNEQVYFYGRNLLKE